MSNRLRHERELHKNESDGEQSEDGSDEEQETDSNNGDDKQQADSTDGEEEDMDSNEEEDTVSPAEAWTMILEHVYNDKRLELPEDRPARELVNDKEWLKETVNNMVIRIGEWQHILRTLTKKCQTFRKLQKTQMKLMKTEDYSTNEALEKAFKDRKGLIIGIVQNNVQALQEVLDEGNDDEDNTVTTM